MSAKDEKCKMQKCKSANLERVGSLNDKKRRRRDRRGTLDDCVRSKVFSQKPEWRRGNTLAQSQLGDHSQTDRGSIPATEKSF